MERRAFVKDAFGFLVLLSGTALGGLAGCGHSAGTALGTPFFTTPAVGEPETASGPLVMAGIDLFEVSEGSRVAAFYGDTELFNINPLGAALLELADGARSIDQIAADATAQGNKVEPLDVALFFSSLDQAGYLRNHVLVSVWE